MVMNKETRKRFENRKKFISWIFRHEENNIPKALDNLKESLYNVNRFIEKVKGLEKYGVKFVPIDIFDGTCSIPKTSQNKFILEVVYPNGKRFWVYPFKEGSSYVCGSYQLQPHFVFGEYLYKDIEEFIKTIKSQLNIKD